MAKLTRLSGIFIVSALTLFTLTACDNNTSSPTPMPTSTFAPVSATWDIAGRGVLLHDVDLASTDDAITVHIARGTIAEDSSGNSLAEMGMATTYSHPAPDTYRQIIASFDFSPSGATFDPGIEITLRYDPAVIPSGIRESQLIIACYDEMSEGWQYINGAVNPYLDTITFTASHFSTFTIQTPMIIPPEPEPIETWVIAVPVVAALLLILCVSLFLYSRYKKHSHQVSDEDLYPPEDEDEEF